MYPHPYARVRGQVRARPRRRIPLSFSLPSPRFPSLARDREREREDKPDCIYSPPVHTMYIVRALSVRSVWISVYIHPRANLALHGLSSLSLSLSFSRAAAAAAALENEKRFHTGNYCLARSLAPNFFMMMAFFFRVAFSVWPMWKSWADFSTLIGSLLCYPFSLNNYGIYIEISLYIYC